MVILHIFYLQDKIYDFGKICENINIISQELLVAILPTSQNNYKNPLNEHFGINYNSHVSKQERTL